MIHPHYILTPPVQTRVDKCGKNMKRRSTRSEKYVRISSSGICFDPLDSLLVLGEGGTYTSQGKSSTNKVGR